MHQRHVQKTPDYKDLVLEHLVSLGLVVVYGHHTQRWVFSALVELQEVYVEHRSQHVQDWHAGSKGVVGISGVVVSVRPAYMPVWNAVDADVVEAHTSHSGLSSSRSHIELVLKEGN